LALVGKVHDQGKRHPQGHPHPGPGDRLLDVYDMGLAMKNAQVQRQHEQDKGDKSDPHPDHGSVCSKVEVGCLTLQISRATFCVGWICLVRSLLSHKK